MLVTCTLPSESNVFPSRVKHSAIVAVPILKRPCNQWLRPIKNIYLTFEQSNNWNSLSNLCQIVKCPPLFLTACIVSKTRSIVVLFRVKKQPEKKQRLSIQCLLFYDYPNGLIHEIGQYFLVGL